MAGLARLCIRRKNLVLFAWIAMLVMLAGGVGLAGSAFSDSSRLPASNSSTAYNLLARGGSDAAKVTTGTIVWDIRSGSALSPAASSRIVPMLASVARVEGVKGVISPFTAAGAKQVSADSRTAYATVVFTSDSHEAAATLGLLRAEGDAAPGDPRAPVPTIEHLDLLLDSFSDAGMRLTAAVHGEPGSLSGPADLAFYRIVQEALTNATKHAAGSDVSLDIAWSAASVHLTVSNTGPAGAPQGLLNEGTGHGLIGMRERAAAAGGPLSAGTAAAGGYRVTATLPVLNAVPAESAAAMRDPHRSGKPVTS